MSTREDGGPAFPAPELGAANFNDRSAYPGMSLRDFFAANVHPDQDDMDWADTIKAAIVGRYAPDYSIDPVGWAQWIADWRAAWKYMQADAMLTARSSP